MTPGDSLHERFVEQAWAFPDRVAVTASDAELTYRELDERADVVAARLRAAGVERGDLVALCLERTPDLVVGTLAILKAGAAYVPIDPGYPQARIEYLLADAAAPVVVSSSRVLGGASSRILRIDEDGGPPAAERAAPPAVGAGDPAYVIYTSGSTGAPNGVVVEHGNVLRLFEQSQPLYGFDEHDVWTLFHSVSFDFSVWELWGALLYGGRLVIVPSEVVRSPEAFLSLLAEEGVTVLNQTPSAFGRLVAAGTGASAREDLALRAVIFGGERLDVKLLAPWIEAYGDDEPALYNMYGITETTVHVTARRIRRSDLANTDEPSPIGQPLRDTRVSLRDGDGRPVPDGEAGEIYVAGPGVSRGYLHRPELTAERFLDDLDGDGVRWYRSRDRAVLTAGGQLGYLGRLDDQLKVRGFRIEPGEVETRLAGHPDVASAVVVGVELGEGDARLVAYVVPLPGRGDESELTEGLAAWARVALPDYMCPSRYRVVATLPTTGSGKTDREALRTLELAEAAAAASGPGSAAGEDGVEDAVLEIVRSALGDPEVGPDDDLFDYGATSLTFARILTEVNRRFDAGLTGAELDEATADCLASYVSERTGGATLQTTGG